MTPFSPFKLTPNVQKTLKQIDNLVEVAPHIKRVTLEPQSYNELHAALLPYFQREFTDEIQYKNVKIVKLSK